MGRDQHIARGQSGFYISVMFAEHEGVTAVDVTFRVWLILDSMRDVIRGHRKR